jgi:helicase
MDIGECGLSEKYLRAFREMGYSSFYPTQEAAVQTGYLEGGNLVAAVPTASGKSLIAYLAIARTLQRGRRAVYVVPLKALAEEKYRELKGLGMHVALSIGDYDASEPWLAKFEVVVTTSEKCDSLLRHEQHFFDDVSLLVVDEVHLLDSVNRGPTLEVVMAKLSHTQVVALSATISNAQELADWLGAKLVLSSWRPVKLLQGTYWGEDIHYDDCSTHPVELQGDLVESLVLDGLRDEGQVLVFVNSRRSTQAVAKRLAPALKRMGIGQMSPPVSDTALGEKLAECLIHGVAFHHAGLSRSDRALVESQFREGIIKVIVATPTLAAGVNLPARRVVIRDWRRYDANFGNVPLSALEIQQMMGRAGRPRYDPVGEAVIVAKAEAQALRLMDAYIHADTEPVTSKLASEDALRSHVLALCVPGASIDEISSFFEKTFYSHQFGPDAVLEKVAFTLDFLRSSALVSGDEHLTATRLGKRVSELYIDPLSGIELVSALKEEMGVFGMLCALCHTPDMPTLYLKKGEHEIYDEVAVERHDQFLTEVPDSWYEPDLTERDICDIYDIGPGDLNRLREQAQWLAFAFREIARVQGHAWKPLDDLSFRLQHGVGQELIDLARVRGIGRVRARKLFALGIRTEKDLRAVPLSRLERILGKKTALSIKQELGLPVSEASLAKSEGDATLD